MTVAAPENFLRRALPELPRTGWPAMLAFLGVVLAPAPWVTALADSAGFEVRSASAVLADGRWYVNARVDCRLSGRAESALRSGVPLRFRIEVELDRVRSFWPDATVTRVAREQELSYLPLTEQFVVSDAASGEQQFYGSLFGALDAIGRVSTLPLIAAAELDGGETYLAWLRAGLDREGLPGQSRFFAWWSGRFAMVSEWYPWSLGK